MGSEMCIRDRARHNASHEDVEFLPGSLVLLHQPRAVANAAPGGTAKLAYRFSGPWEVLAAQGPVTYRLRRVGSGERATAHVQRIRQFLPWVEDAVDDVLQPGSDEESVGDRQERGQGSQWRQCCWHC